VCQTIWGLGLGSPAGPPCNSHEDPLTIAIGRWPALLQHPARLFHPSLRRLRHYHGQSGVLTSLFPLCPFGFFLCDPKAADPITRCPVIVPRCLGCCLPLDPIGDDDVLISCPRAPSPRRPPAYTAAASLADSDKEVPLLRKSAHSTPLCSGFL
jgi:hypothetical protein